MGRRQTLKNTLMAIAVILLMAFAVAASSQMVFADDTEHTWNVKSITFTPAEPTVKMSQVKERDNDGIYALNLANRYKKGMNNCFFKPGDKCVVIYNDNSTKDFEFSKIKGVSYAEFKAADGEIINLEALHTDNAEELKKSGEVSVDDLAAIIGENRVAIEYGEYWEEGEEVLGHCVRTYTKLEVKENIAHDHTTALRERNKTDALCDATGMSRDCQYCQICGKYFEDFDATIELNKDELIKKMLEHDWSEWTTDEADPKKKRRICNRCQEEDLRIVDVHVHTPGKELHWTKPTCEHGGIDYHYVCTDEDCGALLIKNDLGDYVQVERSALKLPARGHKKGKPIQGKVKPATCSYIGGYTLTYNCERCGMHLTTERIDIPVDPDAHVWNDGEVIKDATCTETGIMRFTCTECEVEKDEDIPAGHKWGKWNVTKAATCTVAGSQERTCSACNKIEKKSIAAKGHKWKSAYTVDKKATYAAAGSKSIHCSACNAKKPKSVVSIPKLKVKAVTLTGVKAVKRGFTAKWTKGSGINGYEMQYALNKKFTKSKKTIVIKKPGTISKKVTKLKAKKKYYVRIRAYKIVNKKKYYSAWGKIKTVTTKR